MCFLIVLILVTSKCKIIPIFKVPEALKEVITEKKVHLPQRAEVVPVKGTFLTVPLWWDSGWGDRKDHLSSLEDYFDVYMCIMSVLTLVTQV